MNMKRIAPFAFAAILAASTAGVAVAKEAHDDEDDAAALAHAKISLTQAIAAAEQQAGGKAVGAGVDNENGTVRIAVEIADGQGTKTLLVDPQTGQVTASHDGGDHEDEGTD